MGSNSPLWQHPSWCRASQTPSALVASTERLCRQGEFTIKVARNERGIINRNSLGKNTAEFGTRRFKTSDSLLGSARSRENDSLFYVKRDNLTQPEKKRQWKTWKSRSWLNTNGEKTLSVLLKLIYQRRVHYSRLWNESANKQVHATRMVSVRSSGAAA